MKPPTVAASSRAWQSRAYALWEMKKTITLLILSSIFLVCAKEGMPPGGPEDKTPPRVVATFPPAGSTQVGMDVQIEIAFTERMEKKKTEESIFISPLPETPWDFSWHKNRVNLKPPEPLRSKTTYVITIGTGAVDLRRNRMRESYSFAFSTGDFIDSCEISGETQTEGKKEAGISIWAYPLDEKAGVDILRDKPTYVTQTDFEGKYNLKNLRFDRYRLFAVKDNNGDLEWDIEDEPLGVTTQDVTLDSAIFSRKNMNFVLTLKDTSHPSLIRCQALDRNGIELDFDESLEGKSIYDVNNYVIAVQNNPVQRLEVLLAYLAVEDKTKILLVTGEMDPAVQYLLVVSHVQDESGNEIDPAFSSCSFPGTGAADTVRPVILSTQPKDGEKDVALDSHVKIFFSEPPEKKSLESNLTLTDENEDQVQGKSFWESPVIFVFKPDSLLSSRNLYKVQLREIIDLSANPLGDSLFEVSFTTLNQDTLGSVSGEVRLSEEKKGDIVVVLGQIGSEDIVYQIFLESPGEFLFDMVLPGRYLAKAFLDEDKNGKHDIGTIFPYAPAEPYTAFPDTIPVRSRWETEKVYLTFE